MIASISDGDFIALFREMGPAKLARKLGINERNALARRATIEQRLGIEILVPDPLKARSVRPKEYPQRTAIECRNGIVIVASDCHYWPGEPSIMHRALVAACKEHKPKAVILNGDVLDFPQISRHGSIMWESRPKLADEIENGKERCHEIEKATFKARKIWTLGNHDQRFETRLATVAPEYAKIHGVHLKDHFSAWEPCWSSWINDDVVVKHRFKSGIHAPHNNTMWSGKTTVTGHLHSAKVIPFTDYNGTRYGVDGGCIADTDAKAFVDYTEDGPKNWRSAFCILTFKDGKLLQPELVLKWSENEVQFRGVIFAP